ncbi:MAG: transporter substrate-binding domain-containing protein [Hyphomicrobiales bacterium]|nr:transporter substrate-binding domain-containing protein [Hyphomicrobiales bacterium]
MAGTKIAVGYEPGFAPLTFRDEESGHAKGLFIEVLTAAFGRCSIEPEYIPADLAGQDGLVAEGRLDAVAMKAAIPERAAIYDFSDSVMSSGAAWFALDAQTMKAPPRAGERIATPLQGPLHAQLSRDFPEARIVSAGSYIEALKAVIDGDADRAALNFHIGHMLARRDFAGRFVLPDGPYQHMQLPVAFAKGRHEEIRLAFNRALDTMRADGELAAIEKRWLAE